VKSGCQGILIHLANRSFSLPVPDTQNEDDEDVFAESL